MILVSKLLPIFSAYFSIQKDGKSPEPGDSLRMESLAIFKSICGQVCDVRNAGLPYQNNHLFQSKRKSFFNAPFKIQ